MRTACLAGKTRYLTAAVLAAATLLARLSSAGESAIVVIPERVELQGNFARAQLLVARPNGDRSITERSDDLTTQATYESSNASVVSVSPSGQLLATGNGDAKITVNVKNSCVEVPVAVTNLLDQPQVGFTQSIRPILNKAGCAMAACHASQHGKGGFKLSVFGFEPEKDRDAMVRDGSARRVDLVEPDRSLVLLKPTMQIPHGGGRRLEKDSVDYQILLAWIACGGPAPKKNDAEPIKLTVTPALRVGTEQLSQQLRAIAEYSDGAQRDVTASARYDSLDDGVVSVSSGGLVTAIGKGQGP